MWEMNEWETEMLSHITEQVQGLTLNQLKALKKFLDTRIEQKKMEVKLANILNTAK